MKQSRRAFLSLLAAGTAAGLSATAAAQVPFVTFGFPATGTATNRTMPDRLLDVKNVKDFGAAGNGIANDTAAIQAAIDYVTAPFSSANRGAIFFPVGTYLISSSLTYNSASGVRNIAFIGAPGAKILGNFGDSLLKRVANSPLSGTFEISCLTFENTHATGTSITAGSFVGGKIYACNVSSWRGIDVSGSQSVTVDGCSIICPGGVGANSIGVVAGNANVIVGCDISSYAHGIRHSNVGLVVDGGRLEVNVIGIMLGMDPSGATFGSSSISIHGVSMEANDTHVYCNAAAGGHIQMTAGGGVTMSYGLRVVGGQDLLIGGAAISGTYTGAGISLEGCTRVILDGCSSSSWNIAGSLDSYELRQCNTEVTVAQLPVNATVGTILPVSNATATTVGSTVAGGGANHVAVVRSATVWRII